MKSKLSWSAPEASSGNSGRIWRDLTGGSLSRLPITEAAVLPSLSGVSEEKLTCFLFLPTAKEAEEKDLQR